MEGTVGGRSRIVGLRMDEVKVSESVDLVRAHWEADGFRVTVADVAGKATEAFSTRPTAITYLDESTGVATAAATSFTVKSTAAFPSSGYIHLNTEAIAYSGKTSTSFTGLTRARWNTRAQYHYSPDGERQRFPEVSDLPQIMEGRRCRLYAYGSGDPRDGNGALFMVGVVRTEPSFDGTTWSFTVDPLSSLLDAEIGSDLEEPTSIRGIYYPATGPLLVEIFERSGASIAGTSIAASVAFALAGFWESNEAFLADLNTQIAAQMAAPDLGTFTQNVRAIAIGDSWGIRFTTGPSAERFMSIQANSATDNLSVAPYVPGGTTGVATVTTSTDYVYRQSDLVAGLGTVPRATINGFDATYLEALGLAASRQVDLDVATYPRYRLYLSNGAGVTANTTSISVEWSSNGVGGGLSDPFTATVTDVDTTARSVDFARPSPITPGTRYASTSASPPTIRMGRDYGVGSLADFIEGLTAQTSQYVNTGAVPDLWAADIDVGEIRAAAAASSLTSRRQYVAFAEASLRELIEEECKLLGVYPCLDSNGKITFRRLRLPSASEAASASLDVTSIIVSDGYLSYEQSALGIFNTFTLRTGYDAIEGEHKGTSIKVRDVAAFGLKPSSRAIEVAPFSLDPPGPIPLEDVVRIAGRVLGVFGGPYAYLTIEVPLTRFGVLLGDAVSITWAKVPDGSGGKGVTAAIGLVVSRKFFPMEGRGELTLLLTTQRIGGYVPASKVTLITGTSGTTGPFTLSLSADYFPSGQNAASYWQAGDLVRVYRWGSATAGTVLGTVSSVVANNLIITTATNWSHSGSTWAVGGRVSTAISRANQKLFVHLAGSDLGLDWSDVTDQPPFTLAP